jgi:hypothetical protein
MTHQEQINIILQVIKNCTTWDQLQVLSKHHSGIPELRMAINERACQIADGLYRGKSSVRK